MAQTAVDVLSDPIHDWDVDVVFGLPGDGINGIMEASLLRGEPNREKIASTVLGDRVREIV